MYISPGLLKHVPVPVPSTAAFLLALWFFGPLHGPAEEDQGCTILVPWPQGHGEWPQAGNASWTRNSGKWGGDIRTLFRNGRNGRGNGTNWFCQKVTVWVKGETTFGCLETEEGFTLMNYLFDFSLFLPTMDNSNFFFNQEKGFLEMYGNVTMKQCA